MHETIYDSGAKRLNDQQARPRNNFKAKQADQVYAMSKAKMKNSSEQDKANWHLAKDLHSEFRCITDAMEQEHWSIHVL